MDGIIETNNAAGVEVDPRVPVLLSLHHVDTEDAVIVLTVLRQ